MSQTLPFELIQNYRRRTFRLDPPARLRSREDAVAYVQERGFVFFWPITGVLLPSLWVATAGDRPVADEHDDPGHVTWGWKDATLGSRDWYYAKVLRKKSTMLAFDLLPYFYALSENYGSYEDDYLTLYEQGRLTLEAKQIYETLLDKGRMDTVELRKATHMTSSGSEGRFNKAITDLQADFKILPVAVTRSGAWHYAFAYDLVARYYPEIQDQAHDVREDDARCLLAQHYLQSVGACQLRDLTRLFRWTAPQAERVLSHLASEGIARTGISIEGETGEWAVWSEL
jgi:hypothetical protein